MKLIPFEHQTLRFAADSWMPVFAGMTEGADTQVRHAGESRHLEAVPKTLHTHLWGVALLLDKVELNCWLFCVTPQTPGCHGSFVFW
jgi:hypothetical protein